MNPGNTNPKQPHKPKQNLPKQDFTERLNQLIGRILGKKPNRPRPDLDSESKTANLTFIVIVLFSLCCLFPVALCLLQHCKPLVIFLCPLLARLWSTRLLFLDYFCAGILNCQLLFYVVSFYSVVFYIFLCIWLPTGRQACVLLEWQKKHGKGSVFFLLLFLPAR